MQPDTEQPLQSRFQIADTGQRMKGVGEWGNTKLDFF
jgi:hypothetical protein